MGKAMDLTGQKIGKLTLLERKRENNRTYYYCKCDCGNKVRIRADQLKTTRSCGCLAKETQFKSKNLKGNRYGRLIALESTKEKDKNNGSIIWKCKCDCGNLFYASSHNLTRGAIRSCGCLGIENSKNNMQRALKKHLEKHIVEDTNLQIISRKELISSNTSGITGVMRDKKRNKWISVITFKKKVYYLGTYSNKKDAIKARRDAEEKLFGEFLEWYKNR